MPYVITPVFRRYYTAMIVSLFNMAMPQGNRFFNSVAPQRDRFLNAAMPRRRRRDMRFA
jgi:hypothetical protein